MKQKGTSYRFPILLLFLAFTLICSGSIYAQDLFNYNLNGNNAPGTVWNPSTTSTSGGQIYRGEGAAYNPTGFVAPCSAGNYTSVPSCAGSPTTAPLAQCSNVLTAITTLALGTPTTVTAATGAYNGGSLVCTAIVPPATTVGSYSYSFDGDWTNYYDYLNAQLKAESETAGTPTGGLATSFVATEQCMSCHNSATLGAGHGTGDQGSYLLTGHKNGFRKVVTNQPLHSSDGSQYTGITWGVNTPPVNSTGAQVYYNIAGWMSPGAAPDINYVQGGSAGCAYCHVAGYNPVTQSTAGSWGTPGKDPLTWWQGFGTPALAVNPGPEPTQVIPATGVTITGIAVATAGVQASTVFTFTGTLPSQLATNSYVQVNGFSQSANDELLNGTIFQVSAVSGSTITATSTIPDSYYPVISSTTETGTMNLLLPIPANSTGVLRLPENSTTGDSSWYESGVTCERCHLAEAGASALGSKTGSTHGTGSGCSTPTYDQYIQGHEFTCVAGGQNLPLYPAGTGSTELCMECHRLQVASTKGAQAITPLSPPVVKYSASTGAYSDGDYQGSEFLNSPHSQYLGTLNQNAQGTNDLSINFTGAGWAGSGTFYSIFTGANQGTGTANSGCTGCHDPHQTIVGLEYTGTPLSSAPAAIQNANLLQPTTYSAVVAPGVGTAASYTNQNFGMLMGSGTFQANNCDNCHSTAGPGESVMNASTGNWTINHSVGPGTMFPNSTSSISPLDIPGACMVCHMQGASGQPQKHFFRINASASYYTYNAGAYSGQTSNYNATAAISGYTVSGTNVTFTVGAFTGATTAAVGDEITVSGVTPAVANSIYIVTAATPTTFTASLLPLGSPTLGTYSSGGTATISALPYNTYQPGDGEYAQAPASNVFINGGTDGNGTTWGNSNAIGLDVDIACGQCHGGGTGNGVNPYGIATTGAPNFSRAYLASVAAGIHGTATGPALPAPTFTPAPGPYTVAQTVTLNDTTTTATVCYTTNGYNPTAGVAGTCDKTPPGGPANSEFSVAEGTAITVAKTETVAAIATEVGALNSPVAYGAYTISPTAKTVAVPVFSLKAGTYTLKPPTTLVPNPSVSSTLTDATAGATICYTTDGGTPTATVAGTCDTTDPTEVGVLSGTVITVSVAETVKAIGTLSGYTNSSVFSAAYVLIPAAPAFSPGSETYYQSYGTTYPSVALTADPGAAISYCEVAAGTGSCTPPATPNYTGSISVSCISGNPPCGVAIYANAQFSGTTIGSVSHATYFVKPGDPPGTPKAATPTFSPLPGPITGATPVTITEGSTGVCSILAYTTQATCVAGGGTWTPYPPAPMVCYSVNGPAPVVNPTATSTSTGTAACTTGTPYAGAITVGTTEGTISTIRAAAGGTGYLHSAMAVGDYTYR